MNVIEVYIIIKRSLDIKIKIKPEGNCLSNADKSPVERLSLNRSQCGGCSTKYNTLTET